MAAAAAALALGAVVAILAGYLAVLSVAAFFYRDPAPTAGGLRLRVLVPAHDEESLVGRSVASLIAQAYPRGLFEVTVIADNCTDSTAAVAAAAGADVLVRNDAVAVGKGRALSWAIDRVLASDAPDAIVVVDADSVADPGLLSGLAGALARGAEVAQAEYLLLEEDSSPRAALLAAALLLFHRARFRGRAVLGMPPALVGNGMIFRAEHLRRHPWRSFTGVEDLEHTVALRLAGVRPAFAATAVVRGPMAAGGRAATIQRRRWEGGRFAVMRRAIPALVAAAVTTRARCLDAALDLAVPPLSLLALVAAAGLAGSAVAARAGALPPVAVVPWAIAMAALAVHVVGGLVAAGAPRRSWTALALAPFFVARKLVVYATLLRRFDAGAWERTPRASRRAAAGRVAVAGIPLDPVDLEEAVSLVLEAALSPERRQVATVNLDFLATAHRHPDVRQVLLSSDLNLADGAPVTWLARLRGGRLPERVAGLDLVPAVAREAARRGLSIYLLGGEGGAACEAAAALERLAPGLRIAGCEEPPRSPLEQMDDAAITARVRAARADILLVAFGHPKQERWIARNRGRLGAGVAIGVGCCFDVLAGRSSRAPRWMQRVGLEWLHRVVHDPRRLAARYGRDFRFLAEQAVATVMARAAAPARPTSAL